MLFQVVHKWVPCHREVLKRSHVDKTIFLLKIENKYVPIVDSAVKIIEPETEQQSEQNGEKLSRFEIIKIAGPEGTTTVR